MATNVVNANFEIIQGNGSVVCEIDRFPLGEGLYHINIGVGAQNETCDYIPDAGSIIIQQGDFYKSGRLPPPGQRTFFIAHTWRHGGNTKNLNKERGRNKFPI